MILEFTLRLIIAGILGIIIGAEREYRAKEAGHRTHFLVALGSALLMIISQYGFPNVTGYESPSFDPSRIAAQVVTGIGFLGAGTIIFKQNYVRGLTTAAGIWATSAIGLAIGAGMFALGVLATTLVLVALETINFFTPTANEKEISLTIRTKHPGDFDKLTELIIQNKFTFKSFQCHTNPNGTNDVTVFVVGNEKRLNTLLKCFGSSGITITSFQTEKNNATTNI